MCLQTQGNKVEKVYNETLPVNAASELRKRPPSMCVSSKGNVMQKAKVRQVCVCVCENVSFRQNVSDCSVLLSPFQAWESKKPS